MRHGQGRSKGSKKEEEFEKMGKKRGITGVNENC